MVVNQLCKVQRLVALLTTGAFRSTATDILEYHAFLPPTCLRLNASVYNATVRLASLPLSHPLHKHVTRCTKYYPRTHRSPLHEMFQAFPAIRNVETINTALPPTTWIPQFTSSITSSRNEAIVDLTQYRDLLCIFTDGSGFEGGIGASAYTKDRQGQEHVRKRCLGSALHHTVFEGKVVGLILALDII